MRTTQPHTKDAVPQESDEPPSVQDRPHLAPLAPTSVGAYDRRRYVVHVQPGTVGHVVECPRCRRPLAGLVVDPDGLIDGLTVACHNKLALDEREPSAVHRHAGAVKARCPGVWTLHLAGRRLELTEAPRSRHGERRAA